MVDLVVRGIKRHRGSVTVGLLQIVIQRIAIELGKTRMGVLLEGTRTLRAPKSIHVQVTGEISQKVQCQHVAGIQPENQTTVLVSHLLNDARLPTILSTSNGNVPEIRVGRVIKVLVLVHVLV